MSITIKHIDGNLAEGQPKEQTFPDSIDAITFGREHDCQIVYAPEYTVVGKKHFQLLRQVTGDYCVNLLGQRYVEINGVPADNNAAVPNGAVFRLGDKKSGPSFKVEIDKAAAELPPTAPQTPVKTWRDLLMETRRLGAVAASMLAVVVLGTSYYFYHQQQVQNAQLAALGKDLEVSNKKVAARAKQEFSQDVLERLEAAVYLVAKQEDQGEEAEGTAWAFAPNLLATNAHVTQAIMGHEDEFFLVAPDGTHISIKKVVSHPGYLIFGKYKTTQGTTRYGNFTPLDLMSEYDVGIIEIDPSTPLPVDAKTGQPVTLEMASDDQLEALAPGTPVASVGFPVENLVGSATATKAPATLHFGFISSLTDVFMCRTDPAHRLLIQHSVPVTGGASGSPLIDPSGKVIGLVNGGNTTVMKSEDSAAGKARAPNAALINFAQRVDLLRALADGKAADKLAQDQVYWDKTAKQFDNYFDVAVKAFKDLAAQRYNVGEGHDTLMGSGVLDSGDAKSFKLVQKTYTIAAVPGHLYGFIADAEGGVPIGINVKKQGTDEFLRDAKDPRQSSELELAPTAWVTVTAPTTLEVIVWSLVTQPAKYALHVYSWEEPTTPAAGSPTAESQQ
jgi:S1-C subfamily serine protease